MSTVFFKLLLHKMQSVFSLSVYAEYEQRSVEPLSPSGSPGALHSALLGKAGLPSCFHLFLLPSLKTSS